MAPNRSPESLERSRLHRITRHAERMETSRQKLGGKCVRCGTTEQLEFDHIDPPTKVAHISVLCREGTQAALDAELAKCQLLCKPCHIEKSLPEMSERMKGNRQGEANKGKVFTPEHRRNLSLSHIGKNLGNQNARGGPGNRTNHRKGPRCR